MFPGSTNQSPEPNLKREHDPPSREALGRGRRRRAKAGPRTENREDPSAPDRRSVWRSSTGCITLTCGSNTVRITSKGQVTIPIEMREQLGLLPNTEVHFELDGDAVRITKAPRPVRSRGREIVEHTRGRGTVKMTTDEIMRLMRG